ncbi:Bacterial domain of uncharacterised function (DUF403) [Klebsiella grimontii]|uniref:Bacterial domain of uncharacterized function (DUF403) n=1 Tax=Klebsiella grimontii TaxID=2058152 RepID=A0A7H4P1N1_9ENTR|nr:Bacterial domain of uncharacterised function (DUF403) [Klebsiella grimontii]
MLSRTASELFWMARYLERAESYARVLDVTWKLSMIPRHSQQSRDLALPLNLSLTHELFQARHARFTMSNLLNFFRPRRQQPVQHFQLRRDGVEQRPRGARQPVGGGVGKHQRHAH